MREKIVLFALLLAVPIPAFSQVIPCEKTFDVTGKTDPDFRAPIFEMKKPFEHPVALPGHVLAMLRADPSYAGRFESTCSRGDLSQIPPEWSQAAEIKWADDKLPGLIVRPANTCLWTKDGGEGAGDFWLFRHRSTGYEAVFTIRTPALQVLNTSTNGYPDLCTTESIDRWNISQTVYTFKGGRYEATEYHHVNVDYF